MPDKDISPTFRLFAANLVRLRNERKLSQEEVAHRAGLDKAHIGYIEQHRNVPSIDTAAAIAEALNVPLAEMFAAIIDAGDTDPDLARLNAFLPAVRRFQELADEYGINDVFQDNGGKLLQTLVLTGLQNMPGREGNDAKDNSGMEWELKTVNQKLTKSFSTHHHLTVDIVAKYRLVNWLFCVYESIEIVEIWIMTPEQMEPVFQNWEEALAIEQEKENEKTNPKKANFNNPKIPLSFVREVGTKYYSDAPDDQLKPARKLAYFDQKFLPPPPKVKKAKAPADPNAPKTTRGRKAKPAPPAQLGFNLGARPAGPPTPDA
jgi:transcriptional regulator with XRE-family HTH domain